MMEWNVMELFEKKNRFFVYEQIFRNNHKITKLIAVK